jgi:AbrB family looped-hinge helix DNA binding protein
MPVTQLMRARVSSKGQIAIPKHIRDRLGLKQGVDLTVRVEGNEVILRKVQRGLWRKWSGRLKGSGLLAARVEERRKELARDAQRSRLLGRDGLD